MSTYDENLKLIDWANLSFCIHEVYLASTFVVCLPCYPDGFSVPYLCSLNIGFQAHTENALLWAAV